MAELTEYEKLQQDFQEELRLNVGSQVAPDPTRAARVLNVGAHTGMPYDLIDANLDVLEAEVKRGDFNADAWMREAPEFAKFASENPYHLSVLKQDEENLTKWERAWRPISLGWESTWAQVEQSRIYSRHADGNVQEGDEQKLADYEKLLQDHDFGAENPFAKTLVWTAKNLGPMLYTIGNAGDEMLMGTSAGMLTGGVMGTAAGGVGMVPGVIAGGTLGMGIGFKTGLAMGSYELLKGEAYGRYIKMGFTHENAAIAAKSAAAIGAGLEAFGINMFVKSIPGAGRITSNAAASIAEKITGDVLARQTMKLAAARVALRYGQLQGVEITTEVLQDSAMTVAQNILADVERRPENRVSWDQYLDQVEETAVETAKAVVLISALGPTMQAPGDYMRARQAQKMRHVYQALGEASADSELRKNVPSEYKAFVERQTKDGPVQNLMIDADRFTEYFQEVGQDPNKVAADLGIDLEAAKTIGTDLEIPVLQYAEKIAPTVHHGPLSQDIKSHEDQFSAREADIWYKNADELAKAMFDEEPPPDHEPVIAILDQVRNELVAAGTEFSAAEKQAALTEHAFSVLAKRNGMEPEELFGKYWGGVQRDVPGILQKADIDIFVDPLIDRLRTGQVPTQRDIFGESMSDFLKSKGGLIDQGGELAARDVAVEMKGLIRDGGMTFDAAAELAFEAGFLAEYDTDQLLNALDQELRGEPVFGRGADPEMAALAKNLEDLGDLIDQLGVDLDTMSNSEVRAALTGELSLSQDEIIEIPGVLPSNIERVQDFSGLTITREVAIAGRPGDFVTTSQPAQTAFDSAADRMRSMQDLLECVNA